jgi:uncharacterized protein YbjT (DUF2867 family)/nitrite reductase/ring-hydroxylating ferredoxin subunit
VKYIETARRLSHCGVLSHRGVMSGLHEQTRTALSRAPPAHEGDVMRIVVIGSTGLIGSRLVTTLRAAGHEAVAASPESGVDTVTGEGLAEVLRGTAVVVDLSDPPCCDDEGVMRFFTTSTRNLLGHEVAAGVTHHVALSLVGTEHLLESAYFRARRAQEELIKASPVPYSIVRATLLFEWLAKIADIAAHGATVRVPPVLVQPIAADDVVRLVAAIAVAPPLNGTIEIGGPEPFYLDGLVERVLGARNDPRKVIVDAHARYFGAQPGERYLMAGDEAELGEIRFDDWLRHMAIDGPDASAGAPIERASLEQNEFRVSDVPHGSVLLMGDIAVFSVAGGFCATQSTCPHRGGPLSEGTVDDTTVTCPLHGSQFNIWTGAVLRGPAKEPLKTYRVTIDGDIGRVDTGPGSSVPANILSHSRA